MWALGQLEVGRLYTGDLTLSPPMLEAAQSVMVTSLAQEAMNPIVQSCA